MLTDTLETDHHYFGQFNGAAVVWALNLPVEVLVNRSPWGGWRAGSLWLNSFTAAQFDDDLFDVWVTLTHRPQGWYGRAINFRRLPIGVCVDGVLFK